MLDWLGFGWSGVLVWSAFGSGHIFFVFSFENLRWSLGGQGGRIRGEERGNLIAGEGHMFWSWSVVAMGIVYTRI